MLRPTPWPTSARTTEKPASSTTVCTAWPMSERWLPTRVASIAANSERWQVSSSRRRSGSTLPIGSVTAESATKPRSVTPTSTDRTSPSASVYAPGMPWTIMSFGDAQIEPGKPR